MKGSMLVIIAVIGMAVAQTGDRCFFVGEVTWQGDDNVDYAVVRLHDKNGFRDSLHLQDPNDYQFGHYSNYTIEQYEPWDLSCWLVIDGGASVPMTETGITWDPEYWVWRENYTWWYIKDFAWGE